MLHLDLLFHLSLLNSARILSIHLLSLIVLFGSLLSSVFLLISFSRFSFFSLFAHLFARAPQATCNPDHRRPAALHLAPPAGSHAPLLALVGRVVSVVDSIHREPLMYACELVQALREALDGGSGNHNENGGLNAGASSSASSSSSIESSQEVQALRAKIAGDAALRENFAEMFGGVSGGGGGDDDNDDDADEQ